MTTQYSTREGVSTRHKKEETTHRGTNHERQNTGYTQKTKGTEGEKHKDERQYSHIHKDKRTDTDTHTHTRRDNKTNEHTHTHTNKDE